ncbi:alcohol dehydrogenase zinc-binding domain protein [Haloferax mucosum ATCC BAA-1512]|uniref:Alcohol dehydrogenase zinc-binding domain protein n=1 Tax=Haloferax mucosum ATCC BAA-1512 TaxID=662479 RepID=M0IQ26_9EURY|nr:2,3-butanediol dehydrogenase [Haloferax mucosum]ELZ98137.1 alcohol dehydrogenase zinc-binding domain protein [Haloferax mucosum ATCC BAA-1512]
MQAAHYYGQKDVRIEDIETRAVGETAVRIEVDACGICGSDLHEYAAGPISVPSETPHPLSQETAPVRMGHEFSGTVTEVGTEVVDLEVGDAVVVNPVLSCGNCRYCRAGEYHTCEAVGFIGLSGGDGGFAESVVVDTQHVVPLGDDVPIEHGALVEPLSVGLHAVRRSEVQAGDSVAVFGSGPIGLAVIQCARAAGAGRIYVSEPRQARRERAIACGANEVIDPSSTDAVEYVTTQTDGGADVTFEVAGVEASFNAAVQSTKRGGTATVVSTSEAEIRTDVNQLVLGERTVTGSLAYLAGPRSEEEFGRVIDMLADGRLDPEPLVTDRISLEALVEDGFEQLLDPESEHVKILVKPNE